MSPCTVTTGIGGVVPGIVGRAEGAETTGSGLGELLLLPNVDGVERGGGGGAEGAETAFGTGAGECDGGAFAMGAGWPTEKGGDDLTDCAEGIETGRGEGGVILAAVAGR